MLMKLFNNVTNGGELHDMVVAGTFQGALVKAGLITDPLQVEVAVAKALASSKAGRTLTRSLFTEILFNLSPSKNIRESLTTFGMTKDDRQVLLIVLPEVSEPSAVESALSAVKGDEVPLDMLKSFSDVSRLCKIHKLAKPFDENLHAMNDIIVSRIATKGLV